MIHTFIRYVWFFIFVLALGNIAVFASSMQVGNEIHRFETETQYLHKTNSELERKIYQTSSLQNASERAIQLEYTKKAEPIFLERLKYALNR